MTAYISIGNFTIASIWAAILLAIFLAGPLYGIITRTKVTDWYWNGIFYYLLTWKLSYILFQFPVFIDSPISALYFSGGTKGHFLGLVVLTIYLLFRARRIFPAIFEASYSVFLFFVIGFEVLINVFNGNYWLSFFHILVFISLLLILIFKKQDPNSLQLFVVYLLVEIFIKSIGQNIFSISSITFIWLGITFIILCELLKKKWVDS